MNARFQALLATAALLTTACGHKVNVAYVQAADVGLPSDIGTVLVINRSAPKNAGEAFFSGAEGLATGEGFNADADTSELALLGLVDILEQTDRYEVLELRVNGRKVDTSVFDKKLDAKTAIRLCKRNDCDAIIALDSLDTNTQASVTTVKERGKRPEHSGRTDSDIQASFRVYDGHTGEIIDSQRLSGEASATDDGSLREAVVAAKMGVELQSDLAWGAGQEYGVRIAPHEVMASRSFYKTQDPLLRAGAKQVKAGDWAGAKESWKQLLSSGNERDQARARFNLAVAAEVDGHLDHALRLANRANRTLTSSRTRRYTSALTGRLANRSKLAKQMGGDESKPKPAKVAVRRK